MYINDRQLYEIFRLCTMTRELARLKKCFFLFTQPLDKERPAGELIFTDLFYLFQKSQAFRRRMVPR